MYLINIEPHMSIIIYKRINDANIITMVFVSYYVNIIRLTVNIRFLNIEL